MSRSSEAAERSAAPQHAPFLLWRLLSPNHGRFALVLALVIADTALASLGVGIVLPVLQAVLDNQHRSAIISQFVPSFDRLSPESRLIALALSAVIIFVGKGAIGMLTLVTSSRLLQRLRFYWVNQIGLAYLSGPFGELAFRKQGELLNDWFNETLSGSRCFQAYLAYLSAGVLVLALVCVGFIVDWRAMLALLVLYAVVAAIVRSTLYSRSSTLSTRKLQLNQALSSSMVEDLANRRDIKLMGAESARLAQLANISDRLSHIFVQSAVIGEVPRVISETVAVFLLMTMVVVSAVIFRLPPESMFPVMVFFSVIAYRLVSAASQMMGARIRALNELESLRRVQEAMARAGHREVLDRGESMSGIRTDIVFYNVDYSYTPGTRVLSNVSFVIPRGKVTLLVGPSGAGKSTLLDILLRLVEPDNGRIEANGRTAAEFRLTDWRAAFGYVSQDVSLFNGSIQANLRLARPAATDDEIAEVCRLAGADRFIQALPGAYEAVVGDRGYSLSGGQRKRIAIARALIPKPSVLILDEATTSFEQSLEQEMLREIKAALPELTIIQVTHRLPSLTEADWIIALSQGHVMAAGRWQDVRAAGPEGLRTTDAR